MSYSDMFIIAVVAVMFSLIVMSYIDELKEHLKK